MCIWCASHCRRVGDKERTAVVADLQKISRAANRQAAEVELDRFAQQWEAKFPTISQMWLAERGAECAILRLSAGDSPGHLSDECD